MKVLYHHRTQAEDAQGVHIHEMVKAFRGLGHDVEIAALVQVDETTGAKVRGAGWNRILKFAPAWLYELMAIGYNVYNGRRLLTLMADRKPDVVYERYSLNTFCGVWASRRAGVPLILEVNAPLYHEQQEMGRLAFARIARFAERWICSHSARTIVVSHVMKEYLVREGVPAEHIVVMPNGIDPERFHPAVSGEAVRRQYGIDDDAPVIGFVGWFRPWHGLEMLLEAVHEARLHARGARVMLVGDGPAYPDLVRYVERQGLGRSVIFTGPVKRGDIAAHIAAMDVAVQPAATAYASPMKLIEYMGMGRCVLAPDQPNITEIVDDGVNGLLFEAGARGSLAARLATLLDDAALRQTLGRRAYETVQQRGLYWSENARRALALAADARSGPR